MSPEERVMAIGEWMRGDPIYRCRSEVMWAAVADAIRAAENDALDRAAAHITAKRRNRHHVCRENCALEIRSLKSPSPRGGEGTETP